MFEGVCELRGSVSGEDGVNRERSWLVRSRRAGAVGEVQGVEEAGLQVSCGPVELGRLSTRISRSSSWVRRK